MAGKHVSASSLRVADKGERMIEIMVRCWTNDIAGKKGSIRRLFTGRSDPAGRDEQYERLYVGLVDDNLFSPSIAYSEAGRPDKPIRLDECLDALLRIVDDRDPDLWALLGPDDEEEPGETIPLSIAKVIRGGAIQNVTPVRASPRNSRLLSASRGRY